MRRTQLIFAVILVPLDYLLLILAAVTAHRLRFETLVEIRPAISLIPYQEYLQASAAVGAVWLVIFALSGLYAIDRPRRILHEAVKVISACTVGVMGLIILIFFERELFTSRFVILAVWVLAMTYVIAGRLLVRIVQRFLFKRGISAHRVALIGGGDPTTDAIVAEFSKHPEKGYAIVRRFSQWNDAAAKDLDALMATAPIDEVFVTDPNIGRETMASVVAFAEDHHLTFRYAADTLATHAELLTTTVAGIPVIEVARTRLLGWGRVYKRVFDIIASFLLIVVTSPIMLITAILVALDSRGPIIYRNERVGKEGKEFDALKFRSMFADVSVGIGEPKSTMALEQQLIRERGIKEGPVYKIKDDPRVTRIGRFIRRYSIDELPQLFNVLRGEMSLVGPRPHQPREVAKYDRHHRRVLAIKPGITGLAQVSGRSDLSFDDEVKLDMFYVENWTPLMDVALLLKTPAAAVRAKGAY